MCISFLAQTSSYIYKHLLASLSLALTCKLNLHVQLLRIVTLNKGIIILLDIMHVTLDRLLDSLSYAKVIRCIYYLHPYAICKHLVHTFGKGKVRSIR